MKIQIHFNHRNFFLALCTAIFFCGCKTAGSKQGAANTESQTASTRQVIVVPVLILSSPDDRPPGDKRDPMPENKPRDPSPQVWKSEQTGVPAKLYAPL